MKLPLYIAGRYLFARKSHNVINTVSAISAAGMAIGTAALILILSVYNGFDGIIRDNLSDFDPDYRIESASGKCFTPSSELMAELSEYGSVVPCIEDNIFIDYGGKQGVARARGLVGAQCTVGSALAQKMGISPRFLGPMTLYYPQRGASISLSDPTSSLNCVKVHPDGLFSVNSELDASLVLLPFETMQELMGYTTEVTALELRSSSDSSAVAAVPHYGERPELGPEFRVLDRVQQHPSLYKMMRYEKAAVFFILLFVVLIVAFNIFGSMSMLIIEKQGDIATLRALGADDRLIKRIFVLEGWLISLLGLLIGLLLGLCLAFLQLKTGFVKMPGGFFITAYPVAIKAADAILTAVSVALTGLLISALTVRRLKAN